MSDQIPASPWTGLTTVPKPEGNIPFAGISAPQPYEAHMIRIAIALERIAIVGEAIFRNKEKSDKVGAELGEIGERALKSFFDVVSLRKPGTDNVHAEGGSEP